MLLYCTGSEWNKDAQLNITEKNTSALSIDHVRKIINLRLTIRHELTAGRVPNEPLGTQHRKSCLTSHGGLPTFKHLCSCFLTMATMRISVFENMENIRTFLATTYITIANKMTGKLPVVKTNLVLHCFICTFCSMSTYKDSFYHWLISSANLISWPLVMSVPHSPNTLLAWKTPIRWTRPPWPQQTVLWSHRLSVWRRAWKNMEKTHPGFQHNANSLSPRNPVQNLSHKRVRFRFGTYFAELTHAPK